MNCVCVRYCTGLVLAVLTGITLGIAMGMILLVTVHCARYRYDSKTQVILSTCKPTPAGIAIDNHVTFVSDLLTSGQCMPSDCHALYVYGV